MRGCAEHPESRSRAGIPCHHGGIHGIEGHRARLPGRLTLKQAGSLSRLVPRWLAPRLARKRPLARTLVCSEGETPRVATVRVSSAGFHVGFHRSPAKAKADPEPKLF